MGLLWLASPLRMIDFQGVVVPAFLGLQSKLGVVVVDLRDCLLRVGQGVRLLLH